MEQLCCVAGPLLNYSNLSAVITATAQLWTSAQANISLKPSANKVAPGLTHLYSSTLLQLEPMLPNIEAQQISNVFWSSARLGLSPDAFVPGMTDALAAKLLQLTKDEARRQPSAHRCANSLWALATLGHEPADKFLVDAVYNHFAKLIRHHNDSQRPNAQNCANLLWALATLGHEAADKGLVDVVCDHFARLIWHHDDTKRPTAQQDANFLWALATLGHQPADKGLIDAVCNHFARLIRHHDDSKRPNEQEFANTMWALASLRHNPADKGLVDAVCNHFVMLIRLHDAQKRPDSQGVSNVMWALAEMNHAPPDGAASAILEWFTRLGKLPRQEPSAQSLSNTLYACAVLRLKVKGHVSLALVDGLLRLNRASCHKQHYCNAAWSWAVLDMLSVDTFSLILERLQPLLVVDVAHDVSLRQDLSQLYQAWD